MSDNKDHLMAETQLVFDLTRYNKNPSPGTNYTNRVVRATEEGSLDDDWDDDNVVVVALKSCSA